MESIGKVIDSLSTKFESFAMISDFNATEFDISSLVVSRTHIIQNAST